DSEPTPHPLAHGSARMTPADVGLLRSAARTLGVDVAHDALERLVRFLDLLAVWNRRIHLTGQRDLASLIRAHAIDSLAPAPHLPSTGLVVDVGSGAGFPGIVLGCLRSEEHTSELQSRFDLVC